MGTLNLIEKDVDETLGHFETELIALYKLAKSKNHDYGADNIGALGAKGCYVRIWDKVSRLKTLLWDENRPAIPDEKIIDTLEDLANYAVITLLLLEDKWGKPDTF